MKDCLFQRHLNYCFEKYMKLRCLIILLVGLIFFDSGGVEVFRTTVRTQAADNRNASVWYRVPENYREIAGRRVGCVCACRKGWCAGGHERIFRFRARSSHREMEFPYGRPFGYGHTWGYENWGDGVIRRAE